MATKRTYGDRCGIARALDVVGERWALLVIRELLLGPKRFTDIRAGLPNIGPDVLSLRLRELEAGGIVRRATLPPPAASKVYELTDRGRELEPVILGLGRWGSSEPFPEGELGPDAAVLALKTMFDAEAARGLTATYELRLGENRYRLHVQDGRLQAARGAAPDAQAGIDTDPETLARTLWHDGKKPLHVEGDKAAARRFLGLFG
jgi:DNA-binding HxlR family transcriptional regulator